MHIVLPAVSADGPAIRGILNSNSAFSTEERDCVGELWVDYLKNRIHSPYRFCVCRPQISNQVIGFACYGKHALTQSTYDLYWIAVDPMFQRTGIGSDLLIFVEDQISTLEGRLLLIETSSTPVYASARKFYKSHHYHQSAQLTNFYAPGDHLIIYSKSFKNSRKALQAVQKPAGFSVIPDRSIN